MTRRQSNTFQIFVLPFLSYFGRTDSLLATICKCTKLYQVEKAHSTNIQFKNKKRSLFQIWSGLNTLCQECHLYDPIFYLATIWSVQREKWTKIEQEKNLIKTVETGNRMLLRPLVSSILRLQSPHTPAPVVRRSMSGGGHDGDKYNVHVIIITKTIDQIRQPMEILEEALFLCCLPCNRPRPRQRLRPP